MSHRLRRFLFFEASRSLGTQQCDDLVGGVDQMRCLFVGQCSVVPLNFDKMDERIKGVAGGHRNLGKRNCNGHRDV